MNHTLNVAKFALNHEGWHSYSTDKTTVDAICAASNLKLILLNDYGQFKAHEENARRYVESKS